MLLRFLSTAGLDLHMATMLDPDSLHSIVLLHREYRYRCYYTLLVKGYTFDDKTYSRLPKNSQGLVRKYKFVDKPSGHRYNDLYWEHDFWSYNYLPPSITSLQLTREIAPWIKTVRVNKVMLPKQLTELVLGKYFSVRLSELPRGLLHLTLHEMNVEIVQPGELPPGLLTLKINRCIGVLSPEATPPNLQIYL